MSCSSRNTKSASSKSQNESEVKKSASKENK